HHRFISFPYTTLFRSPVRFLFAIAPASTSDLRCPELAAASDQSPGPARPTSAQARAFQPGRSPASPALRPRRVLSREPDESPHRSEEHTSELQSRVDL